MVDVIFAPFMLRSNIFFSNVNTEDVFTSSFYIWEKMLLPSINGAKITSSVFQSIYGAKITSSITSSYVIVNILNIFFWIYIYVFVLYLRNIVLITSLYICSGAYMEHILRLRYILKKKMLLRSKDYVFHIFIYSECQRICVTAYVQGGRAGGGEDTNGTSHLVFLDSQELHDSQKMMAEFNRQMKVAWNFFQPFLDFFSL